jgi:hypothetical protein
MSPKTTLHHNTRRSNCFIRKALTCKNTLLITGSGLSPVASYEVENGKFHLRQKSYLSKSAEYNHGGPPADDIKCNSFILRYVKIIVSRALGNIHSLCLQNRTYVGTQATKQPLQWGLMNCFAKKYECFLFTKLFLKKDMIYIVPDYY